MILRAALALMVASPLAYATEPQPSISSNIVLQAGHSWDGSAFKGYPTGAPQLTVRRVTLQPGAQFPWHTHPMPAAGYVIAGTLEVESHDGKIKRRFNAGEALAEMQGIVHRGRSVDTVTELVVFYAGTPGLPIAQDLTQ